jgi:hypothetical protein
MKLIRVGVDLAKNVFQIHGVDRFEKPIWRRKLVRGDWRFCRVSKPRSRFSDKEPHLLKLDGLVLPAHKIGLRTKWLWRHR